MHCNNDVRDAFRQLVEDGETTEEFFDPCTQARFENMDADEQRRWIAGKLWNCTDVMPGDVCAELEMPPGSNYAQAARFVRKSWDESENLA